LPVQVVGLAWSVFSVLFHGLHSPSLLNLCECAIGDNS